MLDKVTGKIEAYIQAIVDKAEISREEFDLLMSYRATEEARSMLRESMERMQALGVTGMGLPALTMMGKESI